MVAWKADSKVDLMAVQTEDCLVVQWGWLAAMMVGKTVAYWAVDLGACWAVLSAGTLAAVLALWKAACWEQM